MIFTLPFSLLSAIIYAMLPPLLFAAALRHIYVIFTPRRAADSSALALDYEAVFDICHAAAFFATFTLRYYRCFAIAASDFDAARRAMLLLPL